MVNKNDKTKKLNPRKMADIVSMSGPLILKKQAKTNAVKPDDKDEKKEDKPLTPEPEFIEEPQTKESSGPEFKIPAGIPHKPAQQVQWEVEEFEASELARFQREEQEQARKKFGVKKYAVLGLLLLILGGGGYSAYAYLPKAQIKIVGKKTEWSYKDAVLASKQIKVADLGSKSIPAEVFSLKKNFTFSFLASGKKNVAQKATGALMIYNVYSSAPQTLVANTRFAAPDGKIFRLDKNVIVPGAKVAGGKLTPSSISAAVHADAAGSDYNIGPSRFTIPGFKGSPKYEGFYAESKESMAGGFVGNLAFAADADINQHKDEAVKKLKDSVIGAVRLSMPSDFKTIDGSEQFNVLGEKIIKEADPSGNFSIFLEGQASVIAFREADVLDLLKMLGESDLQKQNNLSGSLDVKNYKLEYGAGQFDSRRGQLVFNVDFEGAFWQPLNAADLSNKFLAKSEADLRPLINSLANVEKVTISFWPFWVKSVPSDPRRVEIVVE